MPDGREDAVAIQEHQHTFQNPFLTPQCSFSTHQEEMASVSC